MSSQSKFLYNRTRTAGILTEDQYKFFGYISLIFSLNEILARTNFCRRNQNTLFVFSNFFPPENCAVCEIMWESIVERGRPYMKLWGMRIACWIPKDTNTHSKYVILIAFPLQQWFHERASLLRYACIDLSCLLLQCTWCKKTLV